MPAFPGSTNVADPARMPAKPRRRGFGFLGLFACIALLYAVFALISPWAFHIGGRWTPLLYWTGSGRLVTKGGTYPLYIMIYPSSRGGSTLRLDGLRPAGGLHGSGWLCTARGVTVPLDLTGTIYGGWRSTDGSLMEFRLLERNSASQQLIGSGYRGYFDLFGYWHGPELTMNDRGEWSSKFRSGLKIEHASVTLTSSSWSDFQAACRSATNLPSP